MSMNKEITVDDLGGGEKQVSATNPTGRGFSSSVEENAITLLGQGLDPTVVANTLGVSPGRISQLLSNSEFQRRVVELRFESMSRYSALDEGYDKLEDRLLEKLEATIPFLIKPAEIAKVLSIVNSAKRRSPSAADTTIQADKVVQLVMPTTIVQQFTAVTNSVNQVVRAGDQNLVTIQSGSLMEKIKSKQQQLPAGESSDEAV